MKRHQNPPACDSGYFDESQDRWVPGKDCGRHDCPSSTSFDVNAARQRGNNN